MCGKSDKTATVLLVEDNMHVRESTAARLRELGYRVIAASDGKSALSILRGEENIDLLVSDVVMPGGMSGQALSDESRLSNPRLSVLLISAYPRDTLLASGKIGERTNLLSKPFRISELEEKMREAMLETNTTSASP
jgi:CheY-like chemotaxis protein